MQLLVPGFKASCEVFGKPSIDSMARNLSACGCGLNSMATHVEKAKKRVMVKMFTSCIVLYLYMLQDTVDKTC